MTDTESGHDWAAQRRQEWAGGDDRPPLEDLPTGQVTAPRHGAASIAVARRVPTDRGGYGVLVTDSRATSLP